MRQFRSDWLTPVEAGAQRIMNEEQKQKKKRATLCGQCYFRDRKHHRETGEIICSAGKELLGNHCGSYYYDNEAPQQ